MTTREFHFSEGNSSKFWTISVDGTSHTVRYGRMGTSGQEQTKEFSSEAEAQKSADKLIAEKLKKGYVEQGAATTSASTPASAPASAPKKAQAVEPEPATPSAPQPAAPEPEPEAVPVLVTQERSIALHPQDWARAFWRPRYTLPRPPAPPFDPEEAIARLRRITTSHYGWTWAWEKAGISPTLTREEAHFWALAMTVPPRDNNPKKVADSLAVLHRSSPDDEGKAVLDSLRALGLLEAGVGSINPEKRAWAFSQRGFSGTLTLEEISRRAEAQSGHTPGHLILPLVNLFPLREVVEWMLSRDSQFRTRQTSYDVYWSNKLIAMGEGLRTLVLPYLSDAELEAVREQLRPHVGPAQWSSPRSAAFLLAALVGIEEALRPTVESWADDQFAKTYADYYDRPQELIFSLLDPRTVELHMRRLKLQLHAPSYVAAWIAHTEYGALDLIRDAVAAATNKEDAEGLMEVFAGVKAPEAAPYMLELMLSSKAGRGARNWMESNPGHAVAGLLSVALGRGRTAEAAADQIRSLVRKNGMQLADAVLAQAPPEMAEKARALLQEADSQAAPLTDATTPAWLKEVLVASAPKKKAAPLPWITPDDLPPLTLAEGSLNPTQIEAVLAALARDPLGERGPLLQALRRHVDPAVLDRFAWRVFETWLTVGAVSKDKWAMQAIGQLGSDISALKLAPLVRAWPGESQHARAVLGLECLRTIGTDTALMLINGIAQKVAFKGLKAKAGECMEAIAKERGFSRAQLEDRIVPTCDLDERGSRTFDFGPRQFRFVLGPGMKPMVREADGKLRPDLPKPNTKDDAALAGRAVDEWKLLKKQVADVAKTQAVRLEQAMVTGRRWPREDFENLLVKHPLMVNLVRLLVWGAYEEGKLVATFRVTEDQEYADQSDEAFSLDAYPEVGIVHPLHLSEADRQAWGELLSDYELVPPFPQLGRPILGLEPDEVSGDQLTRWTSIEIPPQTLVFTLEKLDWQRGIPEDAGVFYSHSKPFYGADVTAVVEYGDGVPVGYMEGWDNQRISRCFFIPGIWKPEMYPDFKNRVPLSQIDPVVISEILSDLTTIVSKVNS